MNMGFEMRQTAGLSQQQKLSPRLIQSMEILQMPLLALHERLDAELESNIALEVDERTATEGQDEDAGIESQEMVVGESDEKGDGADDFERLDSMEQSYTEAFDNEYSSRSASRRSSGERDAKMDAMANVRARSESLVDQVLHQWSFADVADDIAHAGRVLIQHLSGDGLIDMSLEEILESHQLEDAGLTIDLLRDAQQTLQRIVDPAGLGASTLRECLLLQVDAHQARDGDQAWDVVRLLIDEHLDDLVQNRLPTIVKATDLEMDQVQAAMQSMHRLTLSPGRDLVDEEIPPVLPDVIVEYDEERDQYVAAVCDGVIPPLRVSPRYAQMARDPAVDDETREFLGKSVGNAKWLIESINQRSSSLLNVVEVVLDRQRAWFDQGPRALKPLPMTDVAEHLGVHVATVSRAVSEKWMQTPRGIVPLRRFFSGGTSTRSGEALSWAAVKEVLREVIDEEDRAKPLSDEALAAALRGRGIDIARRTVVKYRQQMGIPPARLRKTWTG